MNFCFRAIEIIGIEALFDLLRFGMHYVLTFTALMLLIWWIPELKICITLFFLFCIFLHSFFLTIGSLCH